jgi:RNA polymerase sigma factor (sigma-70 family)
MHCSKCPYKAPCWEGLAPVPAAASPRAEPIKRGGVRGFGSPTLAEPCLAQDLATSGAHHASAGEHVDGSRHRTNSVVGIVANRDRPYPDADPADCERLRALDLARARTALAEGLLVHPQAVAAAIRVLESWLHRGRVLRRALLLDVPPPVEIVAVIERIHAELGCQRRGRPTSLEVAGEMGATLGRLPWSGAWLIVVLDDIPDGAVADEVRRVAARWVAERNAFIEAHAGLVRHVVKRHGWSGGVPREDLIQEAHLALCRAVERYDPGRGTRFSSYAVPVIRRAMAHAIREIGQGAPVPRRLSATAVATVPLRSRGQAGPARVRRRQPALVSLDATVDGAEDLGTLADRLADPDAVAPDIAMIDAVERARLRDAFRVLPREVRDILTLYWGLAGEPPRSVQQIGQHVGKDAREVQRIIDGSRRVLQEAVIRAHPPALPCTQMGGVGDQARALDL